LEAFGNPAALVLGESNSQEGMDLQRTILISSNFHSDRQGLTLWENEKKSSPATEEEVSEMFLAKHCRNSWRHIGDRVGKGSIVDEPVEPQE
jgi:hypothetical protein